MSLLELMAACNVGVCFSVHTVKLFITPRWAGGELGTCVSAEQGKRNQLGPRHGTGVELAGCGSGQHSPLGTRYGQMMTTDDGTWSTYFQPLFVSGSHSRYVTLFVRALKNIVI